MEKTTAVIRKVGNKFCVFSKDGKNLGCSTSREGAVKRLRQVEFFKNKGSMAMAKYDDVFENMSIADMKPDAVDVPSNQPNADAHRPIDISVHPERKELIPREGTIAGNRSPYLLDQRDHFPVITETQARSAMNRAMQLAEVPAWYSGTLDELRNEVCQGIMAAHPNLNVKVSVPVENVVVALSDGEEEPETKLSDLENPEDRVKTRVPQEKRPSIAQTLANATTEDLDRIYANITESDEAMQAFAGDLVEMLGKQKEHIEAAMALAKRLLKKGLSGEEFSSLISFLQEDVLRHLMMKGTTAQDRRAQLLARIKEDKKKKKKDSKSIY